MKRIVICYGKPSLQRKGPNVRLHSLRLAILIFGHLCLHVYQGRNFAFFKHLKTKDISVSHSVILQPRDFCYRPVIGILCVCHSRDQSTDMMNKTQKLGCGSNSLGRSVAAAVHWLRRLGEELPRVDVGSTPTCGDPNSFNFDTRAYN